MSLGRRTARHDTARVKKVAVDSSVWWEYKPEQRVMTIDGIAGTVTAVLDGPHPGSEAYQVRLDNGMGGGKYTASQLSSAATTTASHEHEATGLHHAHEDYPELGSILYDRPPIERQEHLATKVAGRDPFEIRHVERDTGGTKFPTRVDTTAHHPETGDQVGRARYFPPKRKGGPISIDEVKGEHPGAASAMLNDIEGRHPGSKTVFLNEVKRNNNNPDVTGHAADNAGKPSDWDTHYPNLKDTVHRGMSVRLPAYSARMVNDSSRTKDEHLAELHREIGTSSAGTHWTEDEHAARLFANNAVSDHRTDIPVVLHAALPARKDIETRQTQLYRGGVFPYGDGHSKENEVPIRKGRDVSVTGMSWKPDAPHPDADENGWIHHTYPESKHHTASAKKSVDWDTVGAHYPHIYGDPEVHGDAAEGSDGSGIGEAANYLAHEHAGNPQAENTSVHDLTFHPEYVDPKHIDYARHGLSDPRVAQAHAGYKKDGGKGIPPLVLVHRHGVYQVADGHHRAEAAHAAGVKGVPSLVAYSPHPDEPFSDGGVAPFHGAQSTVEEKAGHEDIRDHLLLDHGTEPKRRADTNELVHQHNNTHFDCPHEFDHGTGKLRSTAAAEPATGEQAEQDLPPCSYCGNPSLAISGDNGRNVQATCGTCQATMSSWGGQFTPELIGDPSNHPSQQPDKDSGGVGGTGNIYGPQPVRQMNDADHSASLRRVAEEDYRMQHQPPDAEAGVPLHDLAGDNNAVYPDDVYTHTHYYAQPHEADTHESISAMHQARGKPNKKVKIYRAMPADSVHHGIQTGNWVTTSKEYARGHGRHHEDSKKDWPVISATVEAQHLRTDGNDLREYGYHGPKIEQHGVAFAGGHEEKVSARADGTVRRVQRKSKAEETHPGFSFSHYKRGGGHDEPDVRGVTAYDADENYAGNREHDHHGNMIQSKVEPEHEATGLHERMEREIHARVKKTGGLQATATGWYHGSPSQHDELHAPAPGSQGHWNTDLGVHFTDTPRVAESYAGPEGSVAHADPGIRNPARFSSESEMTDHVIDWAKGQGHRFGPTDHLDMPEEDRRYLAGVDENHHGADLFDRERWLSLHPNRAQITHGYRQHLIDSGHDGVVHGHPEESHGSNAAISFGNHEVHGWRPVTGSLSVLASLDSETLFQFTAAWSDVRAKAKRLRAEGSVRITVASSDGIGGEVKGDNNVYETVLSYAPGSQKVAYWTCGCKWAAYAWGRSPAYRRFEGRMCSHALAMQFEAQSRGMFGKTVQPDETRPKWMRQRTPVVIQHERDTGKDLTRRAVPPGNMRRTFEGSLVGRLDEPPIVHLARFALHEGGEPVDVMRSLMDAGFDHLSAKRVLRRAMGAGEKICPDCDSPISAQASRCPHCGAELSTPDSGDMHLASKTAAHVPCGECNGAGTIEHEVESTDEEAEDPDHTPGTWHETCDVCDGSGKVDLDSLAEPEEDPRDKKVREHNESRVNGAPHGVDCPPFCPIQRQMSIPERQRVREEHSRRRAAKSTPEDPTHAGVVLKARDTGRILMLQRNLEDEKDPAAGTWEFPGGGIEDGDTTALHAGIREWEEEVGQKFPTGGSLHHVWHSPNGVYHGHVIVIPEERQVALHDGRVTTNPDDPDGKTAEQAAWWEPEHARKNPALRPECKSAPWKDIAKAGGQKTAAAWDPLEELAHPHTPPLHSESENPASTGFATAQDPPEFDHPTMNTTLYGGAYGHLHDQPEAALPSTDGADEDFDNPAMWDVEQHPATHDQIPELSGTLSPQQFTGSVADIVARFQATAGAQAINAGSGSAAGPSQGDIAGAAKAFLEKTALKNFTFQEQQELITEGALDSVMARNVDRLDIANTHYSAIDEALAAEDAVAHPEDLFA